LIVCTGDPGAGEFVAQGGGDRFEGVLARAVYAEPAGGEHAAHRADDHDPAGGAGVDELADDLLGQGQVGEHVGLGRAPDQVGGDLGHRAAVAGPGVADEGVEVPAGRLVPVPRV
jgi:hypothetical protein